MTAAERKHRSHLLLWLAPPALGLLLVLVSIFWRVPTRVQLELATTRLAVTPGGEQYHEILDRTVPFSSLIIEKCSTVIFSAEKLRVADPQQLVPSTMAGDSPHFPTEAWRELIPAGPVKLACRDPAAKLTLQNPDPTAARLGLLDRIPFAPGSQTIIEISPGREPSLSFEIETPQELSLVLDSDLEFVADFMEPEGIAVPFPGDLLTWRARLPEARRMLKIMSGKNGLVLIVTPVRDQPMKLFREPLDLPLISIELLEEDREGPLTSPLRGMSKLSYPDYLAVPAVTIEQGEAVGLDGLSQARLRSLAFDSDEGVLRARFDGIAKRATSRSGAFVRDHRLTLFHTFRYSWRWGLIAFAAVWLVSATWAVFEVWKKFQE